MSILDSAALLAVNITEVMNSLTCAEPWQRTHAAPWSYTSMVNLVTSRGFEEDIAIICISSKLIAAITISFLVYAWGSGYVLLIGHCDGGFMTLTIRLWGKNWWSGLWYRLNRLWCCLGDINFLNAKSGWSCLCKTYVHRLLWNWVFRFGTSFYSCVIVAVLAGEGTFLSSISSSWPRYWRVREDSTIAWERHSCLIHINRKWFFRIID